MFWPPALDSRRLSFFFQGATLREPFFAFSATSLGLPGVGRYAVQARIVIENIVVLRKTLLSAACCRL